MTQRFKIIIKGIVQGVGYRPFIYKLAEKLNIKGWASNSCSGVIIDAEGTASNIKRFKDTIKRSHPPLAKPEEIIIQTLPLAGHASFKIKESIISDEKEALVAPDYCTCKDCTRELLSKKDRRYRYPFINCTNCGARFSIIKDTPYDRIRTTMGKFRMCKRCSFEYRDPYDRRFHAEPNACNICGPHYRLYKIGQGVSYLKIDDPIKKTVELLKAGKIVAVKGIGGFHLYCDASNDKAVKELRIKKDRDLKPFAIISRDIKSAKRSCRISRYEQSLLESKERPIVLLEKLKDTGISEHIAPDNKNLGVMLAYSPIHYLLLGDDFQALVATSGNRAENPITKELDEAIAELEGITEYFLDHDREIYMRSDDSVARIMNKEPYIIRRARGFTPAPIILPTNKAVLAVGAEMKNTFCLTKNNKAFISQHIGDLKTPNNLKSFYDTIKHFKKIFKIDPKIIAHDLHPEYLSTKFAKGSKGKKIAVQHHHAHIASVMAENGLNEKVIGIAYDGTGFGDDGMIWGGELLIADYAGYKRSAHLEYMPLPGGDKANEEPYRMAVSYLNHAFGNDFNGKIRLGIPAEKISLINDVIKMNVNCPKTSSMGRLFDAVSSILGFCHINSFEGQAAVQLEHAIGIMTRDSYEFDIKKGGEAYIISVKKIISGIINDLNSKTRNKKSYIAAKFHNSVIAFTVEACKVLRSEHKIKKVCLGGGCFQNKYLVENMTAALKRKGFKVYTHRLVPTNDGGISLGQAVIAANSMR